MSVGPAGRRKSTRSPPRTSSRAQSTHWRASPTQASPPTVNILSVDQFNNEDVTRILDRGKHWLAHIRSGDRLAKPGPLEGRAVVNLFFENSTRTLLSFALAAGRLGAFVTSL